MHHHTLAGDAQDYLIFFSLTADTNIANLEAAAAVTVNGAPGDARAGHYGAAPVDCIYTNTTAALEAYNTGKADAG